MNFRTDLFLTIGHHSFIGRLSVLVMHTDILRDKTKKCSLS